MSKSIILLHGALGCKGQFGALSNYLTERGLNVHAINFSGHGGKEFQENFRIEQFANELNEYISENNLVKPNVFGYSMGGYVALYLAKNSDVFEKIVTLGTKFNWSPEIAEKESKNIDPDLLEQRVPKFAETLKAMHGSEWKELLRRTAAMMKEMGAKNPIMQEEFSQIKNRVMKGLAENDQMVTLMETTNVFNAIPNSKRFYLQNAKHPIESADTEVLGKNIADFIC
jgi:esterase/lipase